MSAIATPTSSPSVSVNEEDSARADLLELSTVMPNTFRRPKKCLDYATFNACCGSTVLNSQGGWNLQERNGKTFPGLPTDDQIYEKMEASYANGVRAHFPLMTPEQVREHIMTGMNYHATSWRRGNNSGAVLGIGLDKQALIAAFWTPDNVFYGKVEALEFHDEHDGLVSLAWTNA